MQGEQPSGVFGPDHSVNSRDARRSEPVLLSVQCAGGLSWQSGITQAARTSGVVA